jgi:Asp-tRNA(Asn)/Glu-tRNA(Gln) amidotransferase B subunit
MEHIMSAVQSNSVVKSVQELKTENVKLNRENLQLRRKNEELARYVDQIAKGKLQGDQAIQVLKKTIQEVRRQNEYFSEYNAELIMQNNQHARVLSQLIEVNGSRQNFIFVLGALFSTGICAVIYYIRREHDIYRH